MPRSVSAVLEPRKVPVQARSAASVHAILAATLQVLIAVGKERLTTTRVAERAGVSVGTLYQYFPNKTSLLQAVVRHHLETVVETIERVCQDEIDQQGRPLAEMISAVIAAFLEAKMKDPRLSVALYVVSADVDGARIAQQVGERSQRAIVAMLKSSSQPLGGSVDLVASILQGVLAGVSRRLIESPAPERLRTLWQQELTFLACAYVEACAARAAG